MSVATVNPYANHSQLTPLESEVLWEYAKLADKLKRIAALARETSEKPNSELLVDLRELERKMKLVLTLESRFEAEAEAAEEQDDQTVGQYHQSDASLQQRWDDQWQGDESTIMR
ncbi:hypothetical protein A1Q2_06592 [Trichosporon asahii var. asahii CBS 8904]|uniref:DASH complex subunit DAD3 n=1 Tax=Trichosporon asahii var. asahii (strain CBS 8904) TaxID=1220162 RepID=K1VIV2_TRIAC|nr:hypothetical protein A1Q2_06592 [Trichosporon asahii var. asahii CBS 8904]